jgi:catechol 2,3-dioxygenase-like lactoylglutathione lyase family enzyme
MLTERRVHTTLPVADLDAARSFWEGRLGFTPRTVLPTAILYTAGEGSVFAISRTAARPSGAHTQMAFTVPDIEAEVAELASRGIAFEAYDLPGIKTVNRIAEMGSGRAAWFKDPDGNLVGVLELAQPEG